MPIIPLIVTLLKSDYEELSINKYLYLGSMPNNIVQLDYLRASQRL
ncbi:hypothetical protein [Nostoc sp.]